MKNFSEELEKILSQVLMKHHDDISSQDEDAIAEVRDTILSLINGIVPEEIKTDFRNGDNYDAAFNNGFNSCRTEMLKTLT